MSEDDYLSTFLDDVTREDDTTKREEKKLHPTYVLAYNTIKSLEEERANYIKRHYKKSDFITKSHWLFSKSKVGELIGLASQPLFNQNSFSAELSREYDKAIERLEALKEEQLNPKKNGLQNRKKTQLIEEVTELKAKADKETTQTCEELFSMLLNSMPLDVKRKLKINRD